eukprot:CAMPEP_0181173490 /NCGR_PEP_ID=MMETSP1096-20121128/3029_1 /TAXON_ID=156174 ORGANISM="Chrysochromulina ericina, Strain CCMP281" /NCGR_SAMPLE_ID=MMETSP1096 /ASSEMBLY_ACC=CAM_ASM_000453 /LENGTH=57 /DNA_ID=CAMNT_0023261325 /DNA_START=345 /DNA_END=515 /DNA_ORIENTATION=+
MQSGAARKPLSCARRLTETNRDALGSAAMVVGAMGVVGIHDVPYDCKVRLRDVEVYE